MQEQFFLLLYCQLSGKQDLTSVSEPKAEVAQEGECKLSERNSFDKIVVAQSYTKQSHLQDANIIRE